MRLLARFELVPIIIYHHIQLLKKRLRETGDMREMASGSPPVDFIGSVIVPEILTHMIALDLHIDYDEALKGSNCG